MGEMDPFVRVDLTKDHSPPSEPLAVDVRDSQGRLVVRAGERVTSSLMDRLRKMGVLETGPFYMKDSTRPSRSSSSGVVSRRRWSCGVPHQHHPMRPPQKTPTDLFASGRASVGT